MRIHQKLFTWTALVFAVAFLLLPSHKAMASREATLALISAGDGDNVKLDVTGEPSKSVLFYYTRTGEGPQLYYLGTTNSNGVFSTSLSTASYGIASNSIVYVIVDNQHSANIAWPYMTAGGAFSLSEASVALKPRESKTITAYNNGAKLLYLSNNSNPPVANVNIEGNQITIKAINYGSTVVSLCYQSGADTFCSSIYVNVQDKAVQPLSFSQSNVSVAPSQSLSVSIYNNATTTSNTYLVSNNSNFSAIQASVSGSIVNLTATASSSGSAAITVCSSDMSSCGIINASIGNANSSNISFSQNNSNMSIGQSLNIPIYGATSSTFSIFNNSNPTAVQAGISGNTLTLTAKANGSTKIIVCSSVGSCGTFEASVVSATSGGLLSLSQNNLWVSVGQSSSLTVSGGSMPYSLLENSNNIIKATLDGNVISIAGLSAGTGTIDVCSAGGGCISLSVLVNGASTTVTSLSLGQSNVYLNVGKSAAVAIFGNGGYSVASNSSPSIASVTIDGRNAMVSALSAGNTNVSICQNGGQCATLYISVSSVATSTPVTPTVPTTPTVPEVIVTPSTPVLPTVKPTSDVEAILTEANIVVSGAVERILEHLGGTRNLTIEESGAKKYTNKLTATSREALSQSQTNALNYFIVYGTQETKILGAGERAGVISSYQQAYGQLPINESQWTDAIKIGLGRWPELRNVEAENQAKAEFKKVYHREADLKNNKDENAIMIIAYGLRPTKRSTASEASAIKTFKAVYGHGPVNPLAWNIVRAIAYSGTKR